jgi:hypothetical protein
MMDEFIPIWDLHIKPTYSVMLPQRQPSKYGPSARQIKNRENLQKNELTGKLSAKASRRLSNSINWLVASAKKKYIYDKKTGKRFNFKINFVTLTLPTTDHGVTDHFFKKVLLHNFINACRSKFDLKNYVWKVEAQENGNIHAHFTTDTFMHWEAMRKVWNKILSKHGIIEVYKKKHENMTFEEYNSVYNPAGKVPEDVMKKRFNFGKVTEWEQPNSTDVHAVHRVRDVAAYLAAYMSKKEEGKRELKGRLWGCSQNLSDTNKLSMEIVGYDELKFLHSFYQPGIKYKPIQIEDSLSSKMITIGEIFFYNIADWGTIIQGKVLEEFNKHRFNIRHNIQNVPLIAN